MTSKYFQGFGIATPTVQAAAADEMARTLDDLEGLGLGIIKYIPSRRRPPMKRGDAVAHSLESAFGSRMRMGPSWQPAASALANAPDTAAIAVGSAR